MKKTFLLLAVLILFVATNSFSQTGNSRLFFENPPGTTLTYTFYDPCTAQNVNAYVGLLQGTVDGVPNRLFYCVDLCTDVSAGDTLKDSAYLAPKILYTLNNYYPNEDGYSGELANVYQEAAAVQFALWNLSDGFDLALYVPDVTVQTRAIQIAADANANGGSYSITPTFTMVGGGPDDFTVRTFDGNGNPVAVASIVLTISEGTLSTNTTSTDNTGISPVITVTGSPSNNAVITATGNVPVPAGSAYVGLTVRRQKLGVPVSFNAITTTSMTWGALPVELTSFSSSVNNQEVLLSWRTSSEINNSGFEVERKVSGSESYQKVGFINGNGTTNVPKIYLYTDNNVPAGKYNYRLKQIDFNGNYEYHNLASEVEIGTPASFKLNQNYPNPFNPETKISFQLPQDGFVSLKVFDNSGKEVATIVNQQLTSGFHTANFNGSALSSGVYFYRIQTPGFTKVMKMALVK